MLDAVNLPMFKAEDPEAYKKLAEKGIMVAHPVSINGQASRPDIGIGYHATVKFFDPDKDHPSSVHDVARGLKFPVPDPETTGITPSTFKDRFGNDVHVIKLHGPHADQIKENNSKFSHMGYPANYEFSPHISVDRHTWEGIVDSGAKTAAEAGISFGPAQLRQGHKVITTYKHGSVTQLNAPEKKLAASEKETLKSLNKAEDYRDQHTAPGHDDSPMHDLTSAGTFPADIYSHKAVRFYGHHGGGAMDTSAVKTIHSARGNPDAKIKIYRAVPNHAGDKINAGDWVSTTPEYAHLHGVGRLGEGNYKVLSHEVPAKHLFNHGDIHEWGYHPHDAKPIAKNEQPLEKGFKNNLAAAAMAGVIGLASPNTAATSMRPPAQYENNYNSERMLRTIAQVESSGGKFTNHRMIGGKADGKEAFGKYGLMPDTIRETINMDRGLKNKYGKAERLKGPDLTHFMQDNPGLEDKIAERHLSRLEHHFGHDPAKLGFAWLEGINGTYKAEKEKKDIQDHWHVKKIRDAYGRMK